VNIADAVKYKENLLSDLSRSTFLSRRIKLLSDYFNYILSSKQNTIIESFLIEFIKQFISLQKHITLNGIGPDTLKDLMLLNNKLSRLEPFQIYSNQLDAINLEHKNNIKELNNILSGKLRVDGNNQLSFPVVEIGNNKIERWPVCVLEDIAVSVQKSLKLTDNNFIIIPSGNNLDENLIDNIKIVWSFALKYVEKKINNLSEYHEIIIKFSSINGNYIGNSFGIVLAINFIQKLFEIYDARELVKIMPSSVASGGVDKNGNIMPVSEKTLKHKIEAAFYSPVSNFIIPLENYNAAKNIIDKLTAQYPNRQLNIIAVTSVYGIFDRRSLIFIKKKNLFIHSSKKVIKSKAFVITFFILLFFIAYKIYTDYDDNPHHISVSRNVVTIENSSNKPLWSKKIGANIEMLQLNSTWINKFVKIIDIDNDGTNEVIFSGEVEEELKNPKLLGRIACFNKSGELIWMHQFKEEISTRNEDFFPYYATYMIDTSTVSNKILLYVNGGHLYYYPTPIYSLDIETGNHVGKTFWHPGGFSYGFITDIDNDGNKELIGSAITNGFEKSVLFSIELNKIEGTAPAPENYRFIGKELTDFDSYILLPKSDVTDYVNSRYNIPFAGPFTISNQLYVALKESNNNIKSHYEYIIGYSFNNNFDCTDVIIGDNFRTHRDSLVVTGDLNYPLSNTIEYRNNLKKQISYWNGEEFVKENPNNIMTKN